MKKQRTYSITIRFSDNPETDTDRQFRSRLELDAYLQGIDDACGWMDYEIIEQTTEAAT